MLVNSVLVMAILLKISQDGTDYFIASQTKGPLYSYFLSNDHCKTEGRYLASIISTKYNDLLVSECENDETYCWIGLEINRGHFSWIDNTEIDKQFINNSLCTNIQRLIIICHIWYIDIKSKC